MPRKQKAPPGNPGRPDLQQQPIRTPASPGYGQGVALEQAQQAAPLPQEPGPPSPADVQAAASAMPFPPGGIGDPSARPNEPLTAGLGVGAGPGPEVLARPQGAPTVAATLMRLAAESGDPELIEMAQLARAQNA